MNIVIFPTNYLSFAIPSQRFSLHLSHLARKAAKKSAELSKFPVPDKFPQHESGAPLTYHDYYWSISHKNEYVCGVVGKNPVGIDIEKISERKRDLSKKVATTTEWQMLSDISDSTLLNFFKVWTAKEATLKANGVGIAHLLDCSIQEVDRLDNSLTMVFQKNYWKIFFYPFNQHIVAVSLPLNVASEVKLIFRNEEN